LREEACHALDTYSGDERLPIRPDRRSTARRGRRGWDHEALRELKAVFEKAASENNLDLLKPYISENFSAVTYTDREFTDFEAFKARWQKTRDEIVGHGSYKQRRQERGSLSIASGHFGLDAIARCGACRRTA
jgi:hypothetical protein